MSQITTFRFEADGAAVYLPFGYIPDYFNMAILTTDTNIDIWHWWKWMEDAGATGYTDGLLINEGATDCVASGSGISSYDTATQGPTVTTWSASCTPTARSATSHGSYYRATQSNTSSTDFNAIFECVTAGTGGSTEPTWPKEYGGQVTDGSNVWERVDGDAALSRIGYQGVAIDFNISDGLIVVGHAIQADKSINFGDVVGWTSGVMGL